MNNQSNHGEDDEAWKWDFTTFVVLIFLGILILFASAELWWWHLESPI